MTAGILSVQTLDAAPKPPGELQFMPDRHCLATAHIHIGGIEKATPVAVGG